VTSHTSSLGQSVSTVDTEIRTSNVLGCVTEEKGHGAHQVFGSAHLSDRNEGRPLVSQIRPFIEDFAGSVG
jgi:hypothetical protein